MPIRISPTLKKLLIIYIVVFVVTSAGDKFMGTNLMSWLSLSAYGVFHGRIWQFITYSFLHSDVMQLVLNLLVLAFVGSDIEALWGTRKFLTYYAFCTIMAGLCFLLLQGVSATGGFVPLTGATAGIYGLLLAYGILFPDREMLFMMLLPMKAKQFVWVLAGMEFLQALFSPTQGAMVAVASLSGMGAGFIYLWLQAKGFRFKNPKSAKSFKKGSHLRLVKNEPKNEDRPDPKTWH